MILRHATERLIDSVWTLAYFEREDGIEIVTFDRKNPIGYEKERELSQIRIHELEGRIVDTVDFYPYNQFGWNRKDTPVTKKVLNPKYIFSYE